MAVVEIYNTFSGELGFTSEEDPPWKVGLVNTTVKEPYAEVDSWHKILWMHCLYSLGVVWVWLLIMQNMPDSFLIHIDSMCYSSSTRRILFHYMEYSLLTQEYGAAVEHHSWTCWQWMYLSSNSTGKILTKRACEGVLQCGKCSSYNWQAALPLYQGLLYNTISVYSINVQLAMLNSKTLPMNDSSTSTEGW